MQSSWVIAKLTSSLFLEHGIMSSVEMITFLGIQVSMITRVLGKVVERLSVLKYSAVTLSKSEKLIQLPFHKTFRDMVGSERILEFIPSNNMIHRKHSKIVVPPYTRSTAKLLRGKLSFVGFRTWQC
jgi:hypothetical protein